MIEKIKEVLKTEYKNLGFGEKAFDGVAEFLEKTIEKEEDITERVKGLEPLLKVYQGDIDKIRGEKSNLQKELDELKKKHSKATPPKEEEEEENQELKKVMETLKAQEEEIKALKEGKQSEAREIRLKSVLDGVPENYSKLAKSSFHSFKNADDETFEAWLKDVQETGVAEKERVASHTPTSGVFTKGEVSQAECDEIVNNIL